MRDMIEKKKRTDLRE